jgi:hypothetical protein
MFDIDKNYKKPIHVRLLKDRNYKEESKGKRQTSLGNNYMNLQEKKEFADKNFSKLISDVHFEPGSFECIICI